MIHTEAIAPRWDENKIYQRIHVEPGTSVYEYNADIFPDILEEVLERLHMHCCWTADARLTTGVPELDGAEKQLICLFAIEQNVMDRMDEHLAERDLPEAYLLDALVNEIMFNAADDLCAAACEAMRSSGCGVTKRYIPGEEPLALTAQKDMLAAFAGAPEAAAVSMNARGVLWPEKSCLYLFGAAKSLR